MRIENISLLTVILILLYISVLTFTKKKTARSIKALWSVACILTLAPTILLICYQICGRFDFRYVYEHTSTSLPFAYKISALWAGQQGSLLLWASILLLFGFYVLKYQSKSKKAVGIYALIAQFVVLLALLTKPFEKIAGMTDGLGLTPALQDPWMVVHPPLVFISYTAMAILFSMFPMIESSYETAKKWAQMSYAFLGLGIFTGSVWAYRSLGWGGYWAWDAIENIALVPWLILCAYLHGKAHFSKAMCIIPFSLAAFGTFMTRSGVLENISVHAYAGTDNKLAVILLIVLLLAITATIFMVYKPSRSVDWKHKMQDTFWLFRQLTYLYAIVVLLATVLQIVWSIETLTIFYNTVSAVYATLLSLLLVRFFGTYSHRQVIVSLTANTALCMVALLVFPSTAIAMLILFWFCLLPISFGITNLARVFLTPHHICHLLLSIFIIGIVASSGFSTPSVLFAEVAAESVTIHSKTFTKEQIDQHKTLLIHTLAGDYIVTNVEPSPSDSTKAIAYCDFKPLIYLFWIGGFGVLGYSFEKLFPKKIALPSAK